MAPIKDLPTDSMMQVHLVYGKMMRRNHVPRQSNLRLNIFDEKYVDQHLFNVEWIERGNDSSSDDSSDKKYRSRPNLVVVGWAFLTIPWRSKVIDPLTFGDDSVPHPAMVKLIDQELGDGCRVYAIPWGFQRGPGYFDLAHGVAEIIYGYRYVPLTSEYHYLYDHNEMVHMLAHNDGDSWNEHIIWGKSIRMFQFEDRMMDALLEFFSEKIHNDTSIDYVDDLVVSHWNDVKREDEQISLSGHYQRVDDQPRYYLAITNCSCCT